MSERETLTDSPHQFRCSLPGCPGLLSDRTCPQGFGVTCQHLPEAPFGAEDVGASSPPSAPASAPRETLNDARPWWLTPSDDGFRDQPRLLSELGLDSLTVARILEWFALKIWVAGEEGSGLREYSGKSYDPLKIELSTSGGGVAHSYVFNLQDGGRHHGFQSLEELEIALTKELIGVVEWAGRYAVEEATGE